jgi:hypothetical protein
MNAPVTPTVELRKRRQASSAVDLGLPLGLGSVGRGRE